MICHGLPRPYNGAVAVEIEQAVRDQGAMPATVAVIDGRVNVGLSEVARRRLVEAPEVAKCTTRDLPYLLADGGLGATTIAATVFVASQVGIQVMATGGLGGVHRGGELSMDVSADMEELARRPVVVVCSGIKSILDQRRTLERLETLGVPVVGYRCQELPGFYTAASGLAIPAVDDVEGLGRLVRAHQALGLPGAIVVVQPPPPEHAMAKADRRPAGGGSPGGSLRGRRGRPRADPVHAASHGRSEPRRHGAGQSRSGARQRPPRGCARDPADEGERCGKSLTGPARALEQDETTQLK